MKKLLIIGAGGFGREIAQYIDDISKIECMYELMGFIDEDISKKGYIYNGVEVLGSIDTLCDLSSKFEVYVFCAIANPADKLKMSHIIDKFNIQTINIIHPTSYIAPTVELGKNVLISPMCTITTNIRIGNYIHINPQCGIGHDTVIDNYSTLYWNVNTGGFVHIGKSCEIGSKTFIKQGISIGDNVVSGAGSVIVKNINSNVTVKGVPAQ